MWAYLHVCVSDSSTMFTSIWSRVKDQQQLNLALSICRHTGTLWAASFPGSHPASITGPYKNGPYWFQHLCFVYESSGEVTFYTDIRSMLSPAYLIWVGQGSAFLIPLLYKYMQDLA